jgi:hypothetical protein
MRQDAALFIKREDEQPCKLPFFGEFENGFFTTEEHTEASICPVLGG